MDPNQILQELRAEIAMAQQLLDRGYTPSHAACSDFLSKIEELDEWLSKGGYLPADWQGRKPIAGVFEV